MQLLDDEAIARIHLIGASPQVKQQHRRSRYHSDLENCFHWCPWCKQDWSHKVSRTMNIDDWAKPCLECREMFATQIEAQRKKREARLIISEKDNWIFPEPYPLHLRKSMCCPQKD
jgi:hypothetical protein